MRKFVLFGVLILALAGGSGCSGMSNTQKGVATGAVLGAAAGTGIALLANGYAGWGALAGAGVGAIAGGVIGSQQ